MEQVCLDKSSQFAKFAGGLLCRVCQELAFLHRCPQATATECRGFCIGFPALKASALHCGSLVGWPSNITSWPAFAYTDSPFAAGGGAGCGLGPASRHEVQPAAGQIRGHTAPAPRALPLQVCHGWALDVLCRPPYLHCEPPSINVAWHPTLLLPCLNLSCLTSHFILVQKCSPVGSDTRSVSA